MCSQAVEIAHKAHELHIRLVIALGVDIKKCKIPDPTYVATPQPVYTISRTGTRTQVGMTAVPEAPLVERIDVKGTCEAIRKSVNNVSLEDLSTINKIINTDVAKLLRFVYYFETGVWNGGNSRPQFQQSWWSLNLHRLVHLACVTIVAEGAAKAEVDIKLACLYVFEKIGNLGENDHEKLLAKLEKILS